MLKPLLQKTLAVCLFVGVYSASFAFSWAGLEWQLRGMTDYQVNGDGSLTLTTVPGTSGDLDTDNWIAYANLPVGTQFVEFAFLDPQGGTTGGPRAYVSATNFTNGTGEILLQGGMYEGFGTYWTNYSGYVGNAWKSNTWKSFARSVGEHRFRVERSQSEVTSLTFDGVLASQSDVLAPDTDSRYYAPNEFRRVYLGLNGSGQSFSGTYTDLYYGASSVPVPEPLTIALSGLGLALAIRRKRR